MKYKAVIFAVAVLALSVAAPAKAAPVLSQSSLAVGLGQTLTVTVQGSTQVYMVSNNNSSAANIVVNGSQITVTGNGLGSALASICVVGTTSDCTNLNVTVQAGNVVTFNPTNPTLGIGQSMTIGVSGGNGTYSVTNNTSTSTLTTVVNGSTMTLSGVAAGSVTLTVCDPNNSCGTLPVTVSATATTTTNTNTNTGTQVITFSVPNPTVNLNQYLNITMTGGIGYFSVSSNSNPSVVQVAVGNNLLTLYGLASGTTAIKVCASVDGCGTINVTVPGQPAAATTTTATTGNTGTTSTTTTTATNTNTTATTTTGTSSVSLLSVIQAMQAQLTQILAQVQAMASALAKLAASTGGTATGTTSTANTNATVTTGAGKVTFTQLLSLGSAGSEVTALQIYLAAKGFFSGSPSGLYGSLTEFAVKEYQASVGLDAVGYVGPGTRAALNAGK